VKEIIHEKHGKSPELQSQAEAQLVLPITLSRIGKQQLKN
jgi:hypothetical protein